MNRFARLRDQHDKLSPDHVPRGEIGPNFGRRSAQNFFVDLGQFAGDDNLAIAERGRDIVERFKDAMGRFVEDERGGFVPQGLEQAGALGVFWRKKTGEVELIGGQAGDNQAGKKRRWAGKSFDANGRPDGRSHNAIAGVGKERRTGIGDQGARFALLEAFDQVFSAIGFVVLVIADEASLNAIVIEQPSGGASIFAGDPISLFQKADGAVRNVFKVADGRRDYVEAARGVSPQRFHDILPPERSHHSHMERRKASDFPQELLNLFDHYVHGEIDRRAFLDGAKNFAGIGMSATAIFEALRPNYAWAQQVPKDDKRIKAEYVTVDSPQGNGSIKGYFARPAGGGKQPGVLVIHENRGLNPYIEDVARRLATANFLAFAPDGLTSVGGYPGDDEKGATLFGKVDKPKMTEDFIAAAKWLKGRSDCTGKLGAVGFCFGGGVVNTLAVRMGSDLSAGVPFYGAQPNAADTAKIKAPLMLQYAGLDERITGARLLLRRRSKPITCRSKRSFMRARITGFITIRHLVTTKPQPSWRGNARSISSIRI